MSHPNPEVTFKYVVAPDYNPVYINGAHGGVSPRGEIMVNFYIERLPLPDSITHEINLNGTIGNETASNPPDLKTTLVRHVDTGIVLTVENARIFHAWLGERIREAEAIERAKPASPSPTPPAMGDGMTH
ncbi:hypothetical protein [Geobacter sp. AOG1]|uniref:hypothetical protein n=1 Tax=Geobacter sp. AOG1 TaxID=1566346 RepID=UPI001CC7F2C9|nr:hypothetical protein [Geobacter sp. AOG1]GFE58870.1 hypothetical protein AOG1_27500 [Geobacter sp. AOG1]